MLHSLLDDKAYYYPQSTMFPRGDKIHLYILLDGDMMICPTQKIHVARGRHEFSGLKTSSCLPTHNKLFIIPKVEARRHTAQNAVP